jgi:hypothetical protein
VFGRAARISLIVFQALFLNVVLPGHTRGIVTMSGAPPPAPSAVTAAVTTITARNPRPTRTRAECAVCFFAARVTPPPVVDLRLTVLGLLEVRPVPPPAAGIDAPDIILPFHGRAPPAA